MSDELKPCPFCGQPNKLHKGNCYLMRYYGVDDQAVMRRMWNTRPVEDQLRADLAAAQQRIAALEEALSVRVAIDDTNRTLAEDWKQMCRAARAAEKRGLGLDWWDDNGKRFGLLEANIMDRLTRLPEQTEDNNG